MPTGEEFTMHRPITSAWRIHLLAPYFAAVLLSVTATAQGKTSPAILNAPGDLDVQFEDCVESIGVGLVSTEAARALIPPAFVLVGEGQPVTPIVVRTARCGKISVNGHRPRGGTIVQIGAVIVPPDFTGDINNYTFWYYTTHLELALQLSRVGVRAQYVPTIDYAFDAADGGPSPLGVKVPLPGFPQMRIDGLVEPSALLAGSFEANWWVQASGRNVKMDTTVPEIFIGSADLELKTSRWSQLRILIGGNTLTFPILQQFNTFTHATMNVSNLVP
jgi:hypothetical protein